MRKILVGVSSCLMGNKVCADGGDQRNGLIVEDLSQHFQFKAYCPEMAIGMSAPRNVVRLVKKSGEVRLEGESGSTLDVTDKMTGYARWASSQMQELSGFVFRKDSPSCGLERVRLYDESGGSQRSGVGLFAEQVMKQNPLLPVEEDVRLDDPVVRDNFIERVYVYAAWQQLMEQGLTVEKLKAFHVRHKYLLLTRGMVSYQTLARIVASSSQENLGQVAREYICLLMASVKKQASRKHRANVLQHLLDYFKSSLSADKKHELATQIDQYRSGATPLVVPVTLMRYVMRRFPNDYLEKQNYFSPPLERLGIRNSV